MSKQGYPGIDIGKFLCSILVVAIHTQPFIKSVWLDRGMGLITRLAVPFFFVTTGYLLFDGQLNKERFCRYIKKILIYYSIWSVVYIPFNLPISNPFRAVFLTGICGHLWYLPALLFAVIVVNLLYKKISSKITLLIATVLLVVGTLFSTYKPITSGMMGGGGAIQDT